MKTKSKPTVLITDATTAAGAAYATRLARDGHNLILVGRDFADLEDLARRVWADTGVNVEIEVADFVNSFDLDRVEHRLRTDPKIGVFVNSAHPTHAAERLAVAASGGFAERRGGSIIDPHLAPTQFEAHRKKRGLGLFRRPAGRYPAGLKGAVGGR